MEGRRAHQLTASRLFSTTTISHHTSSLFCSNSATPTLQMATTESLHNNNGRLSPPHKSSSSTLASANALLKSHIALLDHARSVQQARRNELQSLFSQRILSPCVDSPPDSPLEDDNVDVLRLPLVPVSRLGDDLYDDGHSDLDEHDEPMPESPEITRMDLPPAKRARMKRYKNYVPEEETIRNDYSLRYLNGGEWPQNWVLGAEPERRFEEYVFLSPHLFSPARTDHNDFRYPKQQRLLALKRQSVADYSTPPLYLPSSPSPSSFAHALSALNPTKFDAILIDPPFSHSFTWADLAALPIPLLAADPSFVFLWVGSGAGDGLERGRDVLARWGYRRCEDVVWVRTNWGTCKGPGVRDLPFVG